MIKASPAWGMVAVLVGVLAGSPFEAQAQQVYKCPQSNGTIGYQATPCATSEKPPSHPTAAQLNAQRAAAPRDDKPYDDPYATSVSSRPHPQAPIVQAPPSPFAPAPAPAQTQSTSSLVADVQARNRRDISQQAALDAHRNDKVVNSAACNTARGNLGVLNEQRPVYSYDNKGNRVYVEDKNRAATIAQTQQQISANCP